jgi:hypothetical protein
MKLKSMLKQVPLVIALAALALTMGCHGSSTPTAETEFQIQVTGSIANTALAATINEAELIFDGSVAIDQPYVPAVAISTLSAAGTASNGSHTVTWQIVSQTTTTPNKYTVPSATIVIFDLAGTQLKIIQIPSMTAALTTGQGISFTFSL